MKQQQDAERLTIVERDMAAMSSRIAEFVVRLEKTVDRMQIATNDLTAASSRTEGRFTALDIGMADLKDRQNGMKFDQDQFQKAITTQLESFRSELLSQLTKVNDKSSSDHEKLESRVRQLENFRWKVSGLALALAALAGKILGAGFDWVMARLWH